MMNIYVFLIIFYSKNAIERLFHKIINRKFKRKYQSKEQTNDAQNDVIVALIRYYTSLTLESKKKCLCNLRHLRERVFVLEN